MGNPIPGSAIELRMPSGCANHYTTAPLVVLVIEKVKNMLLSCKIEFISDASKGVNLW